MICIRTGEKYVSWRAYNGCNDTFSLHNVHRDRSKNWRFLINSQIDTYSVEIKRDSISCTCPDHKYRKVTCKHIFYILGKVAGQKLEDLRLETPDFKVYELFPNLVEHLEAGFERENKKYQDDLKREDELVDMFDLVEPGYRKRQRV